MAARVQKPQASLVFFFSLLQTNKVIRFHFQALTASHFYRKYLILLF